MIQPVSFDVRPHQVDDPWEGVVRGYKLGNALRLDNARGQAGQHFAAGDYGAGANALLAGGDLENGLQVQRYMQTERRAREASEKARRDEGLKYTAEFAGRLADFHRQHKDLNKTLAAFDQAAPRFAEFGDTPDEIAQTRARLASDPEGTLLALGAGAAKQAGYELRSAGDEVFVFREGKLVGRYRGAKTVGVGDGDAVYEIPGTGSVEPEAPHADAPAPASPNESAAAGVEAAPAMEEGGASPNVDDVWRAAKAQESGGDPTPGDAVGPETVYGRALGSTQMLPATAEAMARKLGIRWDPRLMRENTPQALAYQDRLGRAYFEEGLEKYGGDVEKALAYYHGGPNEELWGPKTQAHVRAVMARLQPAQPYEVAAAGEGPPPPSAAGGPRLIIQRPKAQRQMKRPATVQEKAAYGIGADVPAEFDPADGSIRVITGTGASLKRVPVQVQAGYADNRRSLQQIDAAIAAIKQNPGAMGLRNKLGDDINQRVDPKGVPVRAAVANIGSLLIHDRSGAAVTAAEQPRLMPFIPQVTDTAEAAIKKLELLKEQYLAANSEIEIVFGEDAGYQTMGGMDGRSGSPGGLRKDPAKLEEARAAIRKGAPRAAVEKRLRDNGIDPSGL